MKQAAAALDIPVAVLRGIKDQGCEAFHHSRIDEATLNAWIEEHGIGDVDVGQVTNKSQLDCEFLRVRIRRQQHQLELERGEVVPYSDVTAFMTVLATNIKQELVKVFRNELAPSLEGLRAQEIQAKLEKVIPRLIEGIRWAHGKQKKPRG